MPLSVSRLPSPIPSSFPQKSVCRVVYGTRAAASHTALSSPLLVTTRFMRTEMDGLRGYLCYSFSSWVRCVINAGYYPFHNKISVHSCSFCLLCVLSRVKEDGRIKEKAFQIKVWVSLCFLGI